MKNLSFFLLLIIIQINNSTAQSFSFIDSKVQNITPLCNDYDEFYVHMKNEKTDSLRMQWQAIENPMDSCWEFQYSMCDNFNCYLGIPSIVTTMATIGPGDTTFLKFGNSGMTHFSGTPTAKILVWDMDIPTEIDTVTFHLTICSDSTPCTYLPLSSSIMFDKKSVKFFPNPSSDNLNLTFPVLNNGTISISDLSGKEIISIPASGNHSTLNIKWLNQGIYFIRISENGTIEFTEKFIKQ